jgi:hypothetical protein
MLWYAIERFLEEEWRRYTQGKLLETRNSEKTDVGNEP